MPFSYFSKLPIIDYPISKTKTKKGRDILHRFFVDQKYANLNEHLMKYTVLDGDALDVISTKLYRRADYHSIILFVNPAMQVFGGGLPVSSAIQDEYIGELYSDTVYGLTPILPPKIIYDWAPVGPPFTVPEIKSKLEEINAEQYLIIYEGNADPTATSGTINVTSVLNHIETVYGTDIVGWGVLDFEYPFLGVLSTGPSDPNYNTCVTSLLQTLRAVKQKFPKVRWTYYGMPSLDYWLPTIPPSQYPTLWAFSTPQQKQVEIEKKLNSFGPVLRELDWYAPDVYDKYHQDLMNSTDASQHNINEREYRLARVEMIREFLRRNNIEGRPIIPFVSPFFAPGGGPGGVTLENKKIPFNQMLQDQVLPLTEAGCDGIAIWSAANFYAEQALIGTCAANQDQNRVRPIYTVDYFAGITPGDGGSPGWTAAETRTRLLTGLGNAVVDMATAAAGSPILQKARDIYPVLGQGLAEGETVYSWIINDPNIEVDTSIAATVKEWNPRTMTVKLNQTSGYFSVGMILGNESKTALFRVSKKINEKDALHHFEATRDTFSGTPLKKGSIIDPLSSPFSVNGGVLLVPIGLTGISGGVKGTYSTSIAYLNNTTGIPPSISNYIKGVTNLEEEYRKMEKNRTITVPTNNPNLLESLVLSVEEILDGIKQT